MEKHAILKEIKALGWRFDRQGGSHEIWTNRLAKSYLPIPRSKTISKGLAKFILINARKYLAENSLKEAA